MENKKLTNEQKRSGDFAYYKERINKYMASSTEEVFNLFDGKRRRMQVNYDLFNGKLDVADMLESCRAFFGNSILELPSHMSNKDIISGKIKALIGMEMRRPFSWRIVAVNEEATTRKEEEEFSMLRSYLHEFITAPIRMQVEQEMQAQMQAQMSSMGQEQAGQEVLPEEGVQEQGISTEEAFVEGSSVGGMEVPEAPDVPQMPKAQGPPPPTPEQLMAEAEKMVEAKTPEEVFRYMEREHQDPAEVLANQLLQYLYHKLNLEDKFNTLWTHGLISGQEVVWIGVENREPVVKIVNNKHFRCGKTADFIENSSWASYTEYLSLSDIILKFRDLIKNEDIDQLQEELHQGIAIGDDVTDLEGYYGDLIPVVHCEWKDLKPLKIVSGIDLETGEPYEVVVDEHYRMNKEAGDTKVETIWVPSLYEGYKIGRELYIGMGEVAGQTYHEDNVDGCKLSYKGIYYDNLNSESVSLLDRMKQYQYLYNLISYKIEQLMASDKGKITFMKAGLIPSKYSIEQWFDLTFTKNFGIVSDSEEGGRMQDVTQSIKEVDLSLVSDIQKYIMLAEYIERRCGESVGIPKQIEGQIGSNEAVRNTQQTIIQSANILEPYFKLHNLFKKNILLALIEKAKVVYSTFQPKTLSYVLDDFSLHMLSPDYELLDNSIYGLFISDTGKMEDILFTVKQMSHALMQTQAIDFSDLIKVLRMESLPEVEEYLRVSEDKKRQQMQEQQESAQQHAQQLQQEQIAWEKERLHMEAQIEMEKIRLRGQIELQKQAMFSMGFNANGDMDNDGTPDILEVYKAGVNADIRGKEVALKQQQLQQREKEHSDKMLMEQKKINNQMMKVSKQQKSV